MCTRVLGTSIPYLPEGLIAKRLLYDDALVRLDGSKHASRDIVLDLPNLLASHEEKVWIQQNDVDPLYLLGAELDFSRVGG